MQDWKKSENLEVEKKSKVKKTAIFCSGLGLVFALNVASPLQPQAHAWTSLVTSTGVATTVGVIIIIVMQDDDKPEPKRRQASKDVTREALKQSAHLYLAENEKTIVQDLSVGHGAFLTHIGSSLELSPAENEALIAGLAKKRSSLLSHLQAGSKGNFESSMAFYREIGETFKSTPALASKLALASQKVDF